MIPSASKSEIAQLKKTILITSPDFPVAYAICTDVGYFMSILWAIYCNEFRFIEFHSNFLELFTPNSGFS